MHIFVNRSYVLCRWKRQVLNLASSLEDVQLSSEELLQLIQKLLKIVQSCELQEIPPLVYELLKLSLRVFKR